MFDGPQMTLDPEDTRYFRILVSTCGKAYLVKRTYYDGRIQLQGYAPELLDLAIENLKGGNCNDR